MTQNARWVLLLRAELPALLGSLSSDEWGLQTACPGWSVRGVASHLPGQVARPAGTAVSFAADGEGGGTWRVVRRDTCWELDPAGSPRPLACEARTTVDGAIKLYTRDPAAPPLRW